jgi:hypothetical protein
MYHQVAAGNETDGEIALDLMEDYRDAMSQTVQVWIGDGEDAEYLRAVDRFMRLLDDALERCRL